MDAAVLNGIAQSAVQSGMTFTNEELFALIARSGLPESVRAEFTVLVPGLSDEVKQTLGYVFTKAEEKKAAIEEEYAQKEAALIDGFEHDLATAVHDAKTSMIREAESHDQTSIASQLSELEAQMNSLN